jgi:bacteriorhodopsin
MPVFKLYDIVKRFDAIECMLQGGANIHSNDYWMASLWCVVVVVVLVVVLVWMLLSQKQPQRRSYPAYTQRVSSVLPISIACSSLPYASA